MPKPEVSVIIRAKDLTSRVIGQFQRRLQALTRLAKNVGRDLLAFGAGAVGATAALQRLGAQGAKVIGVKESFAKITGDETRALADLRRAAAGTISDLDLMAAHNQAVALGAATTTEEFARMVKASRTLARAQGIDAARGLESLNVGIGRQSKLFLDNLGIILDVEKVNGDYAARLGKEASQLTDIEKKTAFRNAALQKAEELAAELGTTMSEGAEAAERFATTLANIRDRLSEIVATSPAVAAFFDGLSLTLDELAGRDVAVTAIEAAVGRIDDLRVLQHRFAAVADEIRRVKEEQARAAAEFAHLGALSDEELAKRSGRYRDLREELRLLNEEARIIGRRLTVVAGGPATPEDEPDLTTPAPGRAVLGGTEAELRGLRDAITKTRRELDQAKLAEKLAQPGEGAEKAKEKVQELAAELRNLLALAQRFGGEEGLLLATGRLPPPTPGLLAPRTPGARRARPGELRVGGEDVMLPFGELEHLSRSGGRSFLFAQEEQRRRLAEASEGFDDASQVAVAGFLAMGEAAVAGSEQVASSVVRMITSILQALPGVGGLGSALIGGIGGIFGAFLGRRDREPVPVRVHDVVDQAERKLSQLRSGPQRITFVVEAGGVPVEVIERELYDRQARDEVIRFTPPRGRSR